MYKKMFLLAGLSALAFGAEINAADSYCSAPVAGCGCDGSVVQSAWNGVVTPVRVIETASGTYPSALAASDAVVAQDASAPSVYDRERNPEYNPVGRLAGEYGDLPPVMETSSGLQPAAGNVDSRVVDSLFHDSRDRNFVPPAGAVRGFVPSVVESPTTLTPEEWARAIDGPGGVNAATNTRVRDAGFTSAITSDRNAVNAERGVYAAETDDSARREWWNALTR